MVSAETFPGVHLTDHLDCVGGKFHVRQRRYVDSVKALATLRKLLGANGEGRGDRPTDKTKARRAGA